MPGPGVSEMVAPKIFPAPNRSPAPWSRVHTHTHTHDYMCKTQGVWRGCGWRIPGAIRPSGHSLFCANSTHASAQQAAKAPAAPAALAKTAAKAAPAAKKAPAAKTPAAKSPAPPPAEHLRPEAAHAAGGGSGVAPEHRRVGHL